MKRAGFHLCWGITAIVAFGAMACGGNEKDPDSIQVTLTSPADESFVNGQVTVTADVVGEANSVVLTVDGAVTQTLTAPPWEFTWDTTGAEEGLHILTVAAFGPDGAQGHSADCRLMVDRTPPELTVPELELPAVFGGTHNEFEISAADDAGIQAIRLYADGTLVDECDTSPCTIDWDASYLTDGEVEITLEAEDLTGNETSQIIPVLVVNDGTVIDLAEGDGGATWVIPESWATMDLDMKFHWTMPAGTTEIMAVLQWSRHAWPFELAIGVGECPHAGTKHADTEGEGGQVVLHHAASDLSLSSYVADDMWFTHLAAGSTLDMAENVNERTAVGFVVVLY